MTAQPLGRIVFKVTITCDVCGVHQYLAAPSGDELEAKIEANGWTRFAPSGSDLCWRCKGSSPNTIIQVHHK